MFKRIVFNQFNSLLKQGKDPMGARVGSLMMLSVLIILLGVILLFINRDSLGNPSAIGAAPRTLGRLGGILALALVFGFLFLVLGRKARFERYLKEFQELDEYDRASMSQSGFWIFFVPFASLFAWLMWLIL